MILVLYCPRHFSLEYRQHLLPLITRHPLLTQPNHFTLVLKVIIDQKQSTQMAEISHYQHVQSIGSIPQDRSILKMGDPRTEP